MADLNIYYHKQTRSWWTNVELDGFSLRNYIDNYPIGLGTIEQDTNDKTQIKNLYEIHSKFIPDHIKKLNGITEELEENGLENFIEVTDNQLENLLNNNV